ncbi:MAG: hypothetical protein C0391_02790 [Anaerolinea sp.]|nr:hypothetical protein [Anaerolinea sp.]
MLLLDLLAPAAGSLIMLMASTLQVRSIPEIIAGLGEKSIIQSNSWLISVNHPSWWSEGFLMVPKQTPSR